MTCFKQRLVIEGQELAEKLDKLTIFIDGEGFTQLDSHTRDLLQLQLIHMTNYLDVLTKRLQLITENQP